MTKPILIGENNPYSAAPENALLPWPSGCAGWRLCHKVLGLREETYLSVFDRTNLLDYGGWSAPRARAAATEILQQKRPVIVACGTKVAKAFSALGMRCPAAPHSRTDWRYTRTEIVVLPHPSGRSRAWHDPTMERRCRDVLREVLPEIPFGESLQ